MGNHKKGSIETWQPQTLSDKRKEKNSDKRKDNTERKEEFEKENWRNDRRKINFFRLLKLFSKKLNFLLN